MLKHFLFLGLASGLSLAAATAQAQATLGTSPYVESFDNLSAGLPTGVYLVRLVTSTQVFTQKLVRVD